MAYKIVSDSCCPNIGIVENVSVLGKEAPSIEDYYSAFDCEADMIIVFTLSSEICESYMNAMKARHQIMEKYKKLSLPKKRIFVCDTKLTSSEDLQLIQKSLEYLKSGLNFTDITTKLMLYCNKMCLVKRLKAAEA